jgi:4-hydroxybenzoate polyprenyltransferase
LKRNESLFRRTNRNFLHFLRDATAMALILTGLVTPTIVGGLLYDVVGAFVGMLITCVLFVYGAIMYVEHDQMKHERKIDDYQKLIG